VGSPSRNPTFRPNELEKPPRISLLTLFLIQLNSVIMYLMMGAVIASAAIRATGPDKAKFLSYVDSIAITIIVLINATIAVRRGTSCEINAKWKYNAKNIHPQLESAPGFSTP
jgi:magnesium-transporting ATPase (P-type)